jgi:Secretion system C-terminal sorting domain
MFHIFTTSSSSLKLFFFITLSFIFCAKYSYSTTTDTSRVYGVTVDAVNNLNDIVTSLALLGKKPTTRIVFDEWQPATDYLTPATRIQRVSYVMGEILDSYYFSQYSAQQYHDRVIEYLSVLGNTVNIWEIGNEVNGEWLGPTSLVIQKISDAYSQVKAQNRIAALTLYYNQNCWENPQNEMFRWTVNNVPSNIKQGLDYVLVSYYEDDCNNLQPNWQRVFDSLHVIFPNSRLGIGECGTTYLNKKKTYIYRYYTLDVTTPGYFGGCFWWYYKQDCVPYTKPLWAVLNSAINNQSGSTVSVKPDYKISNYPNPFNPLTLITYELSAESNVKLEIFDVSGRLVESLVNQNQHPGIYSVEFDGSNHASGIYFYMLRTDAFAESKKMILLK